MKAFRAKKEFRKWKEEESLHRSKGTEGGSSRQRGFAAEMRHLQKPRTGGFEKRRSEVTNYFFTI